MQYDDNVMARYYGDDNLLRISSKCSEFFNLKSISEMMKICFGMEYTNADKSEISTLVTPLADVTYLKRTFEHRGGMYYGKLPLASISQIVLFKQKGSTADEFQTNLYSFCLLLSRWDKDTYIKYIDQLKLHLDQRFVLKTYEDCCDVLDVF
jgi:hypothetical protein